MSCRGTKAPADCRHTARLSVASFVSLLRSPVAKVILIVTPWLLLDRIAVAEVVLIRVETKGETTATATPSIFLQAVASITTKSDHHDVRVRVSERGTAELTLSPGTWQTTAYADGYWSETRAILVQPGKSTTTVVRIWPAATVAGEAKFVNGSTEHIEGLSVTFSPVSELPTERASPAHPIATEFPNGKSSCELASGAWRCTVPAGTMNAKLRIAGFIPQYVWGLEARPGQLVKLGTQVFEAGASIVGTVRVDPETDISLQSAIVELTTVDESPVTRKAESNDVSLKSSVDERGFFQLRRPPPGEYLLLARRPPFVDEKVEVRVVEGRETTVIEPIVLHSGVPLEVSLDPPLDPNGENWSLSIARAYPDRAELISAALEVPPDGRLALPGVSPGLYLLTVSSERLGRLHVEEIQVGEPPQPQAITLSLIRVQGQIRIGTHPLQGVVSFGGATGGVAVHMESDERGQFAGYLPRAGKWLVEINATRLKRFIQNVPVTPKPSGVAWVSLIIPDTLITGKVMDEEGRPAAQSTVHARRQDALEQPTEAVTDSRGEFSFRGLEGTILLHAFADHRGIVMDSLPQTVALTDDSSRVPEIQLVLRATRRVIGHVVWEEGAVPNAAVVPLLPEAPYRSIPGTTTDAQGSFALSGVPKQATELTVCVGAMGFGFRVVRVPLPRPEPLTIPITRVSGTLLITAYNTLIPKDDERAVPLRPVGMLAMDEGYLPLNLLHQWAIFNGGGLAADGDVFTIPQMEPGNYVLCVIYPSELQVLSTPMLDRKRCTAGVLFPDSELQLPAHAISK